MTSRVGRSIGLSVLLAAAAACGGGSGGGSSKHSVTVSVQGLTGSGLVLTNTAGGGAGEDLAVNADGTASFPTQLSSGTAYAVTVKTQPSGQTSTAAPATASGTMDATDITVNVTCSAAA